MTDHNKKGILQGWQVTEKRVDKNKIPYQHIDKNVINIVKLFNSLSFVGTLGSCEGHLRRVVTNNGDYYTCDGAILLEVYDDALWLGFVQELLKNNEDISGYINVERDYRWSLNYNCLYYRWKISWGCGSNLQEATEYLRLMWSHLESIVKKFGVVEEES